MVEISKEDFYKIINDNDLDICVYANRINSNKLMVTDFKFRNGVYFGINYHNYDLDSDKYGQQTYVIDEDWVKE